MSERPSDTKTIEAILEAGIDARGQNIFFRFKLMTGETISLETNAEGIIEVIQCLQATGRQAQHVRQQHGYLLPIDHPELVADYLKSIDFLLAADGQSTMFRGVTAMGRDVQFELTRAGVAKLEKALGRTGLDLDGLAKQVEPGRPN